MSDRTGVPVSGSETASITGARTTGTVESPVIAEAHGPAHRAPRITAPEAPLDVEFDVEIISGEPGRRLAVLQAEAVLDVLSWFNEHRNHP
jgi:hypothetical protein